MFLTANKSMEILWSENNITYWHLLSGGLLYLQPEGCNSNIVFPEVDAAKGFILFQPRISDFSNKFDGSLRLRISLIESQVRKRILN